MSRFLLTRIHNSSLLTMVSIMHYLQEQASKVVFHLSDGSLLKGLENLETDFSALDRPDPLTDRETEILRLMAGGYSNKEIASSLCVAEGTVKNHVSNILSKLGVRDRTRAVLKAFELGFV